MEYDDTFSRARSKYFLNAMEKVLERVVEKIAQGVPPMYLAVTLRFPHETLVRFSLVD